MFRFKDGFTDFSALLGWFQKQTSPKIIRVKDKAKCRAKNKRARASRKQNRRS